jgi:hypothetical protein
MNTQNDDDREKAIQRREQELQERERAIRLRELEAEIHGKDRDAPFYQTQKDNPSENSLKRRGKTILKWVKFIGFIIVGFAVVRVGLLLSLWLTYALIASVIGFIGYKMFLEKDDSNSK